MDSPDRRVWLALELLKAVNHELQWTTAKWLLSDCFRIVDATAADWLKFLIKAEKVKETKGWLKAV